MQFTVTVATPAPSVKPLPSHNTATAPNAEEAVRKISGQTPVLVPMADGVWQWQAWSYKGFVYTHRTA